MAIFLVQHGKSLPKEQDPEKGLSQEGISDVERIAGVAKSYGIRVSLIKHSGKKRAMQTAEIFANALQPDGGVQESSGLDPLDDVTPVAEHLSSKGDVMLIGHLPFMEKLTSYLTAGSTEKTIFKFQNGGIVCLDQDPQNRSWFIKWTLMPKIG
jgi:phosphohistidine phosphatase